jgi:predicted anti-sigma-YlaC factor YlaD
VIACASWAVLPARIGGMKASTRIPALALLVTGLALPGCSVRSMAVNSLGNALAEGNSVFATDEDPELVREAIPFGLKTTESLLAASPRHKGLLFAAASGFTQYAYAFLQQEADFAEAQDLARATALRDRSRKLYLRARDYGLRGLEVDFPGFRQRLAKDPTVALARTRPEHVRLLYWTAAAWAGAMSLAVNDSSLSADQGLVEALLQRALVLNEGFELGAIHDVMMSFEAGRHAAGGSLEKAKFHFERATTLAAGRRAWPFVSYAESAAVARQDRQEFQRLLSQALAVDANREDAQRLANLIAQRRAKWLLARTDDLFVE